METKRAFSPANFGILGLFVLGIGTLSCASTMQGKAKNMSAEFIGCASKDIIISDMSSHGDTKSWIATCKGKRVVCSSMGGDAYGGELAGHAFHMRRAPTVKCRDVPAAPTSSAKP